MSSLAASAPAVRPGRRWLNPALCFWTAGILVYGAAALHFSTGHFLDQSARDLWQHVAALKALIADPFAPANPFVPSLDGSRHFHPYWVAIALIAKAFGWNEWQAIACAGFVSAGVLLAGIHVFGRAFYRTAWGPLALLAAMVLSWSWPISHTGYHSVGSLIEGIAYPALLLVGLSLLLWGLVIRALSRPRLALLVAPLAASMFATHQLGAGIGFIAAACFIALQPRTPRHHRLAVAAALGAGILLAAVWPYHSPFAAIARTGNASWTGGYDFYTPMMLVIALVPSLIGVLGLRHRRFARRARPVLAAFLLFAALFAIGWFGLMIATRFVMPAVLMLQIGVGALMLAVLKDWAALPKVGQLALFGLAAASIVVQASISALYLGVEQAQYRAAGSAYDAALALTGDIDDQSPVAAYDVAVWPVVATGQRVLSVPWPEPGIVDLAARQALVERLFDPRLSRDERVALARRLGVRHLLIDRHGPLRRRMPDRLLATLAEQSVGRSGAGPFLRFDLY